MSYTNGLDNPSLYFNTKLYSGNSSTQSISGINFKPDFVWIKARNQPYNHFLFDIARGVQQRLKTNSTDAESTVTGLTSFDTDGFSLGSNVDMNGSGVNFASWNWLASNTTASNTDGSITSTVSANTTSGFSIVSYTGTGANATVGHGLGVAPSWIVIKGRNQVEDWTTYHISTGNTKNVILNSTATPDTHSTYWQNTSPTSSVFYLGSSTRPNNSGTNYIAYCFADTGNKFFKAGSYVGNGSSDGSYIHLGMKPAFVIIKRTNSLGSWRMWDNKRNPYNLTDTNLRPNTTDTDDTSGNQIDMLSNGFKIRATVNIGDTNVSGSTYIYMAFAENPFVTSTGVPTCAR